MRIIRTPEEWYTLFNEQQHSGLNITQFCRQNGITRSAFSNASHRLSAFNTPSAAFVPTLPPEPTNDAVPSCSSTSARTLAPSAAFKPVAQSERQLTLILPGVTLHLPDDISARWLATLLREMAP